MNSPPKQLSQPASDSKKHEYIRNVWGEVLAAAQPRMGCAVIDLVSEGAWRGAVLAPNISSQAD